MYPKAHTQRNKAAVSLRKCLFSYFSIAFLEGVIDSLVDIKEGNYFSTIVYKCRPDLTRVNLTRVLILDQISIQPSCKGSALLDYKKDIDF